MIFSYFKNNNMHRIFVALVSVFFLVIVGESFASVSVIANNGVNVDSITAKEAKKIWLSKTKSLAGTDLKVADLSKGHLIRDDFYKRIVKKDESRIKAYWARIVFAGKGHPPRQFPTEDEVIKWVAATDGAMGYVNSEAVNDSVKVLMTLQ